jgi:DNA invertase Pin-like site-specific DNA recombinase
MVVYAILHGVTVTKPRKDLTQAVGYCRCSTAEQATSGAGLDAQRSAITAECERRGWTLLDVFEDAGAGGGTLTGRPALAQALTAVTSGAAGTLVVSKLDRLTRSVLDFANLVDRATHEGWNLAVLDIGVDMTTPSGSLVAGIMANISQWERSVIRQRTRDALAARRASGVQLGRPVLVDPNVAARIAKRRFSGATLQNIAAELNSEGVPTPSGRGRWQPSVIAGAARRAGVAPQPRGRRPRNSA